MKKANLLLNGTNVLAGYYNIDPFAKDGEGKIRGDISNLDEIVDDGELDEILADSVLEYYEIKLVNGIVQNWVNKLERGGKITITVPDLYEICKSIVRREVNEHEANILLYGTQEEKWKLRKNAFTIPKIEHLLTTLGTKIVAKKFSGTNASVTAEKL
jgi:hypothetical protein